jgi:uncharacterized protein YjbI with pentapeptide repeats
MSEAEKIERTPANENPWYWLATVYGEQEEGEACYYSNRDLAAKNRIAWNRWMAPALSEARKEELIAKGFAEAELTPFDETERAWFLKDFIARAGNSNAVPPEPGWVSFKRVVFERPVSFARFIFSGIANFVQGAFFRDADFGEAVFCSEAHFESSRFSRDVRFHKTAFSGIADFRETRFSNDARFNEAQFCGIASFDWATFFGGTYFDKARFSNDAHFSEAVFSGTSFSEAVFFRDAQFRTTKFICSAAFNGAEFKYRTFFTHTEFRGAVPDFRDAKLSEVTEWHGATWPPAPHERVTAWDHAYAFSRVAPQDQVYAYEKLKAEMERLKKHADEQFFFAKELRARRALEPALSLKWLLYFAYEKFGGYGQSVVRPLIFLAIFWAAGAGLFAFFPAAAGRPLDYEDAAHLSLVNLIPFLPYKPGDEIMKHLAAWAEWFGILQAILGAALLFLFGLALRNLFRMK